MSYRRLYQKNVFLPKKKLQSIVYIVFCIIVILNHLVDI
jgi:hypothetical protein